MALDNAADGKSRKFQLNEHARGAIVLVLGCAALVGLSFGAMMVLTSPDGWVTKAANTAFSGEQASLAGFDLSSAD